MGAPAFKNLPVGPRTRAGPRRLRGLRRAAVAAALLLVGAGVALAVVTPTRTPTPKGGSAPPPPTVILQYQQTRRDAALPAYRDLLDAMPRHVEFLIGVETEAQERSLRDLLGARRIADREIGFFVTGRGLGPWTRDRYIPFTRNGARCLYVPPKSYVHTMERASLEMPEALKSRDAGLRIVPSQLDLQGGDLLLTPSVVFVSARTEARNVGADPGARTGFRSAMETLFGRRLEVVGADPNDLPYDHLDMYLAALDDRTLLLGDPRLGLRAWHGPTTQPPELLFESTLGRFLASRQRELAEKYDRLARRLTRRGYRVERVPSLHGEPFSAQRRGAVLNWTNVLLDRSGGRVYVPAYGLPRLDEEARATWRRLGFEPVPIDARAAITRGGAVRCLTSTLGFPD